ncbi:MAG: hypothetical protein JXB49_04200 [Bacteroidales bacterium]|nr:hypothetical protein [Bacteroidales bacterium]
MEEQKTEGQKRPGLLTVLCILTFIGSGLGILFGLLLIIGAGSVLSFLGRIPGFGGGGGMMSYSIVSLVLSVVLLFGAIQMWKLKKLGFYLYTAAKIIGFILPIVWLGMPFNIVGLIIMAAFIVLYGLNLKAMS